MVYYDGSFYYNFNVEVVGFVSYFKNTIKNVKKKK